MDFFEAVNSRYSHKEAFLPGAVPLEHLEQIARAGIAAPSGGNSQCVRLVILPDRQSLRPLCDISPAIGLETAPAAIALFTDSSAQTGPLNFEMEDYAAACENMLLAATALGYAALWLDSPYFDKEKERAASALLNAPEGYTLRVVLPVGLPDGPGGRRKKLGYERRVYLKRFPAPFA